MELFIQTVLLPYLFCDWSRFIRWFYGTDRGNHATWAVLLAGRFRIMLPESCSGQKQVPGFHPVSAHPEPLPYRIDPKDRIGQVELS